MTTPKHIAFICDGNRRWAKRKGLTEFTGHKIAIEKTVENLVDHCIDQNILYVTFWFFSTENWKRGKTWIKKFFKLFHDLVPLATDNYLKKGAKLNFIGDLEKLPKDIQEIFSNWKQKTKNNNKITVTIAFNYGGRDEIIRGINKLLESRSVLCECEGRTLKDSSPIKKSNLKKITIKDLEEHLDTTDLPDPDLLIRTGENNTRLSGFMLWQIAYSQLYFADTLFPDFTPKKLDKAISWWQTQTHNLGK